jgi:hypothetical protein
LLVEDAVVRQQVLAIDGHDAPPVAHRSGIVEAIPAGLGEADDRGNVGGPPSDLIQRAHVGRDKRRLQNQVVRWVTREGQLRRGDDLRSTRAPCGNGIGDAACVAIDVSDALVDLRQCHSHDRGLQSVSSIVPAGRASAVTRLKR